MPMTALPAPSAVITRDECMRLLADQAVGRVVFTTAAMPAAQPVAFVIDRGDIVFRAHGPLGAARKDVVAFEADSIDPHTLTGWSVLGIGETFEILDPARLAGLVDLPAALLGTVSRSAAVIAIRLRQLTGRRVQPADPPR
jgi:uncharacterized protein